MKTISSTNIDDFTPFMWVLVILTFLVIFASCKDDEKTLPQSCDGIAFAYSGSNGPANWADLCAGNAACDGVSQSPVNIANATNDAALTEIATNYSESETHILNNGYTVEFEQETGSSIMLNGQPYLLRQFHFHVSSEHTLGGTSYPMEVHLVHRNEATGNLAVVGIFFKQGAENEFLKPYIANLPDKADEEFESELHYDVADLLPENKSYFTYSGSLTTPPCSEIVTWIVMEKPIEASAAQLQAFKDIIEENNRPIQALNGRTISKFTDN
jgi:carbonic anhydrase